MKKLSVVFAAFLCGQTVRGEAQSLPVSGVFPSVVSIQRQGGEIVTNASGPFVLSQVYYPPIEAPCLNTSTGWFCIQAAIRIDYQGWLLLSGEQVGELAAGQWYVDATSATT